MAVAHKPSSIYKISVRTHREPMENFPNGIVRTCGPTFRSPRKLISEFAGLYTCLNFAGNRSRSFRAHQRAFDLSPFPSAICLDANFLHRPALPDFSLVLEGYRILAVACPD